MSGTISSVAAAIQDIVLDYVETVGKLADPVFHMKDLTDHVAAKVMVAPDSPGRILRDLRRRGYLSYRVEDRARSLYRVL